MNSDWLLSRFLESCMAIATSLVHKKQLCWGRSSFLRTLPPVEKKLKKQAKTAAGILHTFGISQLVWQMLLQVWKQGTHGCSRTHSPTCHDVFISLSPLLSWNSWAITAKSTGEQRLKHDKKTVWRATELVGVCTHSLALWFQHLQRTHWIVLDPINCSERICPAVRDSWDGDHAPFDPFDGWSLGSKFGARLSDPASPPHHFLDPFGSWEKTSRSPIIFPSSWHVSFGIFLNFERDTGK